MSKETYLLRKYGITLKEHRQMLKDQNGACKICGKTHTQDGRPITFHTDHCHAIPKIKVKASSNPDGGWGPDHKRWIAETVNPPAKYPKLYFEAYGDTKSEAVQAVRKQLKKAATRFLVCWGCNSLLAKGRDNHEVFSAAASYLREFEKRFQ